MSGPTPLSGASVLSRPLRGRQMDRQMQSTAAYLSGRGRQAGGGGQEPCSSLWVKPLVFPDALLPAPWAPWPLCLVGRETGKVCPQDGSPQLLGLSHREPSWAAPNDMLACVGCG